MTRKVDYSKMPNGLLWDIETDGIQADRILCIGHKFTHDKHPALLTYDQFRGRKPWWSDKAMLQKFSSIFNSCDYHVTWYGSRFDLPVVNGRLVQHDLPPLQPKPHIDLWKVAREKLGHRRQGHRLQAWQDRLGLRDDKTPVKPSVWIKARHGDKAALKYIYDHCNQDVKVLEGVFQRFLPWVENIPAAGLFSGEKNVCPNCGSKHIVREGYKVALTRIFQQWSCRNCGRWFRSAKSISQSEARG